MVYRTSNTADKFYTKKSMVTPDGGVAVRLTNKTGSASVKGSLVEASSSVDNAFSLSGADDVDPIGVVYEDGIADGSECWVVIFGRAQILLQDSTAATRGYWVRTSTTTGGRADATLTAPPGAGIPEHDIHFKEVGHCLESVTAGTDKLCWIMMHFN